MSKHDTAPPGRTECDRCGRPRPADPERFTVVASDYTDSTVAYQKALLCKDCWQKTRTDLEVSYA